MQHLQYLLLFLCLNAFSASNAVLHTGKADDISNGYQYVNPLPLTHTFSNTIGPNNAQAQLSQSTDFPYVYQQPQLLPQPQTQPQPQPQPQPHAQPQPLTNFAQFSLGGTPLYQHVRQQPAFGVAVHPQDKDEQHQQLSNAPQYFVPHQQQQQQQPPQHYQQSQSTSSFNGGSVQQPTFYVPRFGQNEVTHALAETDCAPQPTVAAAAAAAPQPPTVINNQHYSILRIEEEARSPVHVQSGYFQPAAGNERDVAATVGQIDEANKKAYKQTQAQQPQQQQQQQQQHETIQHFRPNYVGKEIVATTADVQQNRFQFPEQRPNEVAQTELQHANNHFSVYPSHQLSVPVTPASDSLYTTQQNYQPSPSQATPAAHFGYFNGPTDTQHTSTAHSTSTSPQLDGTPAYAVGHKGLGHYQYALNKPIAATAAEQQQQHHHHQHLRQQQQQQQEQINSPHFQLQPAAEHLPKLSAGYSTFEHQATPHNSLLARPTTASSVVTDFLQMQSHSFELQPTITHAITQPQQPQQLNVQQRTPHALYGSPTYNSATTTTTTTNTNANTLQSTVDAQVPQYGGFKPLNYLK